MRVEEGRLVESRCPDCGNLERRAFGETESDHGELASYALGWTAGHEVLVGHISVGLGAGNPGGGTFHIEARVMADGSIGFGFVDEPFEDVPEGGPDLTRQEALSHDCADYVWYVVDEVWLQDRRAHWMRHWLVGTAAFVSEAVFAETAPVRFATLDPDDEDQWILLEKNAAPARRQIHLFHVLQRDPSLAEVLLLEPGDAATRANVGDAWTIEKVAD